MMRVIIALVILLSVPRLLAAQELTLPPDELRLGGAATTERLSSGYVVVEALFSPLPPVTAYDPNFSWLFSPRPLLGASLSVQGKTSDAYAGFAWSIPISGPFFAEASFGGLVHNQTLFQAYPDRPELTTRFLFRESISLGYEINAIWRVIAFADHRSNGNLGNRNVAVNHLGMMLGAKFGAAAQKPATPLPPSVFDFSWAGFYIGLSGGTALGKSDAVIDGRKPDQGTEKFSVIVGGHLGYNWTSGALVTGVEADISAQQPTFSATLFGIPEQHISASSHWLATARARMGVDINGVAYVRRLLLYATGGAAFTQVAPSSCTRPANVCYLDSGDVARGLNTQSEITTGR